ncbi:MAG: hypothetical protein AB7V14_12910, partial [Kiritimatiellia bacterium]
MKTHASISFVALLVLAVSAGAQQADDAAASAAVREIAGTVLEEASARETTVVQVPGSVAAVSDSVTATVTLSAIDAATREITFVRPDGRSDVMTAGPGVANFDQLAVGDQVVVTYTEAVAVYLSPAEAPETFIAAGIERAEDGAAPGGSLVAQGQVTAQVLELDKETRRAKLQLPGDEIRTIQV